ncbi:LysR family transcriptional regulator [Microbacterium sp. 18062]|uniref:LysR family transcriptional regulator n=1 Tax=Microbacterium sp. 18062 TaxID=2681410 RepID=UPI00135B5A89|nr:LysR family transcriptional regulator [Microbacterium sp. 18062]
MSTTRVSTTLSQLEALVAAVDAGNITAAASRLHTTQSNLSVALAKLERQLGAELLVRHRSRGVVPTAAGLEAAARARTILQQARELEEWSRVDREAAAGEVRMGCFLPLTSFYVPALLRALHTRAPGVETSIEEAPMDVLHRLVADADLDLALVYGQGLPPGLSFRRIAWVSPYVIVAADSPFASRGRVHLAELAGERMVSYDLPFTTARTRRLFADLGLDAPREIRATSVETVRALVAGGAGFAILNQRWGTEVTSDGAVVVTIEIADPVEPLALGILTRPTTRSARVGLVGDLLAEHAAERHG